jgi:hypothetical protein
MAMGRSLLSRRIKPLQLIVRILAVVALIAGVSLWQTWRQADAHRRWTREMERLGARVVVAGYEDSTRGFGRVPVVGEILTHRNQVELFVDDLETIDAVLARAAENPDLKRIWLDLTVFDRSVQSRIEQELPGMDVVPYTPGAGFSTPAPRGTE